MVEVNPRIPFLRGPIEVVRSVYTHRHLAANFIARDIRLKYRDSALGYVWSLLEPILMAAVYYVLFVILAGHHDRKHVLWIVLGVIIWQFFAKALTTTVTCLTRHESLIKQVYFPRELFALTNVGSQLIFAALSFVIAIPAMIYFRMAPTLYLFMVPLGLMLTALLALGSGLSLACLNVVNRDVEHVLKFVTKAGMFVSPVLWTIDMAPTNRAGMLHYVHYNPLTLPITLVRHGVEGRGMGILPLPAILFSVGLAVGWFVVGSMIFKRYEAEVIKKL